MNVRVIVLLIVAGAAAITATSIWRRSLPVGNAEFARPPDNAKAEPEGSLSSVDAPSADALATEPRAADRAWRTPSSPSPRYAEPEEIEAQLGQFLAAQAGLELVSLSSIDCGATACEIALTGTEVNPRYVNGYADVYDKLVPRWKDFRILFSSMGTREIAPGAREYVISFEYQPYADLSADALIAARQYAACAAAWRRQTENPTPTSVARQYRERAERYVALAASVLGEEEAGRVYAETRGGPLIRECGL